MLPRLLLATHNQGKIAELVDELAPYVTALANAAERGLPEPEETGTTFHENAALKALAAAKASGMPALADDSGFALEALGGAPGLYSARYMKEAGSYPAAFDRLARELAASPTPADTRAAFICVLAFATPEGEVTYFEGRVDGNFTYPPRGTGGFGYNPVFTAEGTSLTFAEDPALKNLYSHRHRALAKFVAHIASAQ